VGNQDDESALHCATMSYYDIIMAASGPIGSAFRPCFSVRGIVPTGRCQLLAHQFMQARCKTLSRNKQR
jgi:hypothetical protein